MSKKYIDFKTARCIMHKNHRADDNPAKTMVEEKAWKSLDISRYSYAKQFRDLPEGFEIKNCCIVRSDFTELDFANCKIKHCEFYEVSFESADLSFAEITDCVFMGCDFHRVTFNSDNLNNCLFYRCDFEASFNLAENQKMPGVYYDHYTNALAPQCPEEGSFIGWKRCRDSRFVKLRIPESAKRSSGTDRECRCSKAIVMDIIECSDPMNGGNEKHVKTATSIFNAGFEYHVGETVYADKFDENRWERCSNGIHFFMSREEAVMYSLENSLSDMGV